MSESRRAREEGSLDQDAGDNVATEETESATEENTVESSDSEDAKEEKIRMSKRIDGYKKRLYCSKTGFLRGKLIVNTLMYADFANKTDSAALKIVEKKSIRSENRGLELFDTLFYKKDGGRRGIRYKTFGVNDFEFAGTVLPMYASKELFIANTFKLTENGLVMTFQLYNYLTMRDGDYRFWKDSHKELATHEEISLQNAYLIALDSFERCEAAAKEQVGLVINTIESISISSGIPISKRASLGGDVEAEVAEHSDGVKGNSAPIEEKKVDGPKKDVSSKILTAEESISAIEMNGKALFSSEGISELLKMSPHAVTPKIEEYCMRNRIELQKKMFRRSFGSETIEDVVYVDLPTALVIFPSLSSSADTISGLMDVHDAITRKYSIIESVKMVHELGNQFLGDMIAAGNKMLSETLVDKADILEKEYEATLMRKAQFFAQGDDNVLVMFKRVIREMVMETVPQGESSRRDFLLRATAFVDELSNGSIYLALSKSKYA